MVIRYTTLFIFSQFKYWHQSIILHTTNSPSWWFSCNCWVYTACKKKKTYSSHNIVMTSNPSLIWQNGSCRLESCHLGVCDPAPQDSNTLLERWRNNNMSDLLQLHNKHPVWSEGALSWWWMNEWFMLQQASCVVKWLWCGGWVMNDLQLQTLHTSQVLQNTSDHQVFGNVVIVFCAGTL